MAALVINDSSSGAITTPTAPGVPDSSVTLPTPRPGDIYRVIVGATPSTITINRFGTFGSGTNRPDEVLTSVTSSERRIPVLRDYVNPATGSVVVDFSSTATVTAELIRARA